jgi:hypothetical protein
MRKIARKKVKKSEKIDLNFASLCFASKRSEKFDAKISEKKRKNRSEIL